MSTDKRVLISSRIVRQAFMDRLAGPNNPSGALVIAAIMERCGASEQDPANIHPDLVAFLNWFLGMLGLRDELRGVLQDGPTFQRFTAEAQALQAISNLDDLNRLLMAEEEVSNG
jgi:hypothetical protein